MLRQKFILRWLCALSFVIGVLPIHRSLAQSSVGSTSIRPFVLGYTPVFGRRGRLVGGVAVDAEGVITRAQIDEKSLLGVRRATLASDDKTKLRMVSLVGLEKALAELVKLKKPIPEDVALLAGLQRVEYVFALPDKSDIILAGPAESWRIDERGVAMGVTSGRPVVRLDDLLEAFRTAEIAAAGRGISCSIDPTEEGLTRLQQLLRNRNLQFSKHTTDLMQKAVGANKITVTGVNSDSHFARVMVAADYLMKRLAMGLEDAPLADMPSYMDLLAQQGTRAAGTASPRWWLAVNYAPLLRTEDGLSWQLRGPGVKAMTENAFVDSSGALVESTRTDRQAQRWADTMTEKYDELSRAEPVFGELRNCMDLAVVAALLTHYDLVKHVGAELPHLTNGKLVRGPQYDVPQTVEPHLSVSRTRKGWIVGVSGGVDLDSWSVLNKPQRGDIARSKDRSAGESWWWE